jgi:hypothetical protein
MLSKAKKKVADINAKYDAELAALEGAKPAETKPVETAPTRNLNAESIRVFGEVRDKQIESLIPYYGEALRSTDPTEDEKSILADPIKCLVNQILKK